ncbi:prepilin-type N-terminal cleavage/methylation domain-containing protein [Tissierella pigra]|uniref:Prepilin-type N-terminal cleavage/methylation domain-containing protein n=1 Tax=Tissierella pigra TaxID=2607614 RepID=A0A6N7XVS3_9FIRM|nr:prepilin-type N-terminal cleavage/methylation domain-containing protein [Tissierella pigra]MBU5426680.1 prepilin-type N-terminal cleavage/methylation domain-containing protein [Tissierella pigra]MST99879.1 prepilin-type N-terminal cleavage/methylation domain-containing protein [Tissierella pigra]
MSGNINNKEYSSKYGYTLVELLVVLAIFAVVLSIGIPSIRIIFNTNEKKELMEFKRDIIYARNSAIVENCNYTLLLNIEKNSYIIKQENKTIKNIEFSKGIVLKSSNFGTSIYFTPTGAPSKAGTISLLNRKKQKIDITINVATGKVNLYINSK